MLCHLSHRHLGRVAPAKGLWRVDVEVEAVLVLVPLQEVEQLLQVVHAAHSHEPLVEQLTPLEKRPSKLSRFDHWHLLQGKYEHANKHIVKGQL